MGDEEEFSFSGKEPRRENEYNQKESSQSFTRNHNNRESRDDEDSQ